jgi:hypothetical protein
MNNALVYGGTQANYEVLVSFFMDTGKCLGKCPAKVHVLKTLC